MKKNINTPLKSVRKHCLECSGHQPKEVRLCTVTKCPLYPFRLGTNPNRKGMGGSFKKTIVSLEKSVKQEVLNNA